MTPAEADRRREQREAARAKLAAQFDPTRPTNTVESAAAYAGVSRWLAYREARSGAWPAWRCGSRLMVKTRPFLRMIGGLDDDAAR
jgi:hypothetical protein